MRRISFYLLPGLSLFLLAVSLFIAWPILRPDDDATPTPQARIERPLIIETGLPPENLPTDTPPLTPSPTGTSPILTAPTLAATDTATPRPPTQLPPTLDLSAALPTATLPTASLPTVTATAGCQPPADWVAHTVGVGETLFAYQLGTNSAVTVDDIIAANCLTRRLIYEGETLWLPPGAAANAPSSESAPTPLPADPNAPPPPAGLTRAPACPCEITIRRGWRLEQIAEVLDSLPVGFRGADFMAVAGRGAALPAADYLAGAPPGASLEGYMLPGTYTITNEMDALAFRDMVLNAFGAATAGLWGDTAAVNLTPYQAVTLASIIVRESGSPTERPIISSVFHNRLNSGRGLGATVTTQYALGRPGNWWPNVAGQVSTTDSPYNTNIYAGLPPSPIASPDVDAIRAAIYPAQTAYLYFTGRCDGSGNAYAETYEQHLANASCE